jgi:hypothetical protein
VAGSPAASASSRFAGGSGRGEASVTTDDDSRLAVTQRVRAVNGFAYGVIGADIHVFDNERPVYLLASWPLDQAADPDWPSAGPLADLREWRDSTPQLAARWLYGADTPGTSCLAAQLAAGSAATGWKVIAAFHDPDAAGPESGRRDMRLEGAVGVLLLVPDADRWHTVNLTWLLKNQLLHRDDMIARVLMTSRTADAWPAIRAMLDAYKASTSSQVVR